MNRRRVLQALSAPSVSALAGCGEEDPPCLLGCEKPRYIVEVAATYEADGVGE